MRVRIEHLEQHLAGSLAPIYVIGGDEPLQVQEARDTVRTAALGCGFNERVFLDVEPGFDWSTLAQHAESLSLFGDKRIIDLRLPTARPGDAGARALKDYAARPPPDTMLVISTGRIDRATSKTQWFKALADAGVIVQVWPVEGRALPGWVRRRAHAKGLELSAPAAAALAERVEGNLLACAQEIDKLFLLHGRSSIDVAQILASAADSARFDVFDLVDTALAGDAARTVRIVRGLREEGVEPPLVAWALTREIRALARMAKEMAAGRGLDRVLQSNRVWDKRRSAVAAALRRHEASAWLEMLRAAAGVDRAAKGAARTEPWDELERLALRVCGLMFAGGKPYNPAA